MGLSLGFEEGGRCLGFCDLEAETAGSEEGGIQGEDSRVPGEEGCWGRVQDGLLVTPKPPQGPLVHLGSVPLSAAMRRTLTRESQSQKALEPHRGELESPPKREPNPPVHSQKQSRPRYLQTLRKKNVSFYKSQFGHGLLHNITTASTD